MLNLHNSHNGNFTTNPPGVIDDRFPFDFTQSLDYNIKIMMQQLIDTGSTEQEAADFIQKIKAKYVNGGE